MGCLNLAQPNWYTQSRRSSILRAPLVILNKNITQKIVLQSNILSIIKLNLNFIFLVKSDYVDLSLAFLCCLYHSLVIPNISFNNFLFNSVIKTCMNVFLAPNFLGFPLSFFFCWFQWRICYELFIEEKRYVVDFKIWNLTSCAQIK